MARKRLPDEEQLSPLNIRIPASLREQIEQAARSNRRSLNQGVILWLERAAQDIRTNVRHFCAVRSGDVRTI